MGSSTPYEKKLLDRFSDALISALVRLITAFRKDWLKKNKNRVDEWRIMLYALNRSPIGLAGLILGSLFIVTGIVGPLLAPHSYDFSFIATTQQYEKYYVAPPGTGGAILGTDDLGRDLFSELLYGARVSLMSTVLVLPVGIVVGILLGLIAGYYGGIVDEVLMRFTDIFLAFPGLILALAFSSALTGRLADGIAHNPYLTWVVSQLFAVKPNDAVNVAPILSIVMALWVVWWPAYARVARGLVLEEKDKIYVEASRALGLRTRVILLHHIFPNILGPLLVMMTLDIGGVILTEAGLSFILGAMMKIPDWGAIVQHGSEYLVQGKWWLVVFPGLAILISVLGWNLFGDSLRDILDPRTRRSIEFKAKEGRRK
ncbi:MAG: ABC transporter permease [Desulfurococcales archaeon]|nr:ABC transporter permease [Desulfurococcales archaeon]